jgi:hypothetical protein
MGPSTAMSVSRSQPIRGTSSKFGTVGEDDASGAERVAAVRMVLESWSSPLPLPVPVSTNTTAEAADW